MNLKPRSGNKKTSLIFSIDKRWNGPGYIFSFHPKKYDEGKRKVRGLVPILRDMFSDEQIREYFLPRAFEQGRKMKYNPKTGEVTTKEDEELGMIFSADEEFSVYDKVAGKKRGGDDSTKEFGERVKETLVGERAQDEESLSTFNGSGKGSKRRKKTGIINNSTDNSILETLDSDKDSSVSSLSITTKSTINTRLSQHEQQIENIGNQMDQMATMMEKICKAMNIVDDNTTMITPQKQPKGSASQGSNGNQTGSSNDPAGS